MSFTHSPYIGIWEQLVHHEEFKMRFRGNSYKLRLNQKRISGEKWKICLWIDREELYHMLRDRYPEEAPKALSQALEKYHQSRLCLKHRSWIQQGRYRIENPSTPKIIHRYQMNIDSYDLLTTHNFMNLRINRFKEPLPGTELEKKTRRFIRRLLINSLMSVMMKIY